MLTNTTTTYGSIAKFFHWLIVVLLLAMLVFGYFLDDIPKAYQGVTYNIHKLTGLTILALMILRAIWALMNVKPELPATDPSWQRSGARIVHLLLYFLVIAMPLAGWIGSSAGGKPPHLGEYKLLLPVDQSKVLAEAAFDTHNMLAIVIITFLVLHILAALYHYFICKDNVLQRMLF